MVIGNEFLQNGYTRDPATSRSWTRSGAAITVTYNSHNYIVGDSVTVSVSSDTGAVPLDAYTITAKTLNTFTFTGVDTGGASGTATIARTVINHSEFVILDDFENSVVADNYFRNKDPSLDVANQGLLRLNNCANIYIDRNHFKGGAYGVHLSTSGAATCTATIGNDNYFESQSSGEVFANGTGTERWNKAARAIPIHITSAGALGTSPTNSNFAIAAGGGTGEYIITHNFGHSNFTAVGAALGSTPYIVSFVKTSTTELTVHVADNAGTATNSDLLVTIFV
jgi:hypothetical protein